ncbi:MAG TPA: class I SAM-dependent methyltransferase [Reyranella sp.]|nr:class I SAM-dependent methyltransferase [Reyranella sp.]
MTTQAIDTAKAAAFAGRMLEVINAAALAQQMSLGHHAGLFDALATLPPATSEQIAAATGLNERYVREWLASMVTGRVVAYDPARRTYRLPPEHAGSLTRAAGPGNLAAFTQFFPEFGKVQDQLLEAFRNGGGVPYSAYPRFQEQMRELSGMIFDASLLEGTLKLVPGLTEQLEAGIDVADIACGSGHAINLMARAYPNSRFTGYDFSDDGLAAARAEAEDWGLTNAQFVAQDVAALDAQEAYDFITIFDAIHDQAQPRAMLKNVHAALRPGGTFLAVDIAASSNLEENLEHPLATTMYTISTWHCMTVSLAYGGEGLGSMWGEQTARELLAEAGFTLQAVKQVEGDVFNTYYLCTKD